ncbi:MAG: NADH-quinone oxidoreductase subunit D [Candidatus Bathyarchaeia archaeon]
MRVKLGPQHPISGHLCVVLDVDGDIVVGVEPDVGYTHRGIEKIAENRTYMNIIPPLERANIIDPVHVVWGYVAAAEELMGVKVPERAEFIRVIMAELSRITSHLYWLCLMSTSVGLETMLMWPINDRELFLDLLEMHTGARVTYSFFVPGGIRKDLPRGFTEQALKRLSYFEERLKVYYEMLYESYTFQIRTRGVGKLRLEEAVRLGIAGPNLRGSGLKVDVRKDEPYGVYDRFDFEVPVGAVGDSYDRSLVRLREMEQSVSIIRQALSALPEGPIKSPAPPSAPVGEVYSRVESARGELGYYLVGDGSNRPYRLKMSTPSFRNLEALAHLCRGVPYADVPAILWSLDLWPLDIDR